jgi:sirohydrochlorin cobaltochelatase
MVRPVSPGLILFAHGARDPRWNEPFERLLHRVRSLRREMECRLAYLEIMKPDLDEAAGELVALGCDEVRVVPVFLGEGGHVRRDLPTLIENLRAKYPGTFVTQLSAAGEDPEVLEAIARYCVQGWSYDASDDAVRRLDII